MAEEKETTAVDPMTPQEPTTATDPPADPVHLARCPMALMREDPSRKCIGSDCAWWLESIRKQREAGCSMLVLAEAVSAIEGMARKRNWGR